MTNIATKSANARRQSPRRRQRHSFVLIMVLVVVVMLAFSTYTFCNLMTTELESTTLSSRQLQARACVDSAVAHMMYMLETEPTMQESLGGVYNNPELFQAQLVVDHMSPEGRARFGIIAPQLDDQGLMGGFRFGFEDESARLNLNALNLDIEAGSDLDEEEPEEEDDGGDEEDDENSLEDIDTSGRAMLMKLPGMTLQMADAILDWIDEDDEPREYGAESSYYSGETPPYKPQNGPIQSIEELMLIRDITPDLVFGRDINRNGLIDNQELEIPLLIEADTSDGSMDFGWSAYLTLHSQESNVTREGEFRIDVNGEDIELLYEELSAVLDSEWANFIILYRQYGPYTGNAEDAESASNQEIDFERGVRVPLVQILDLVGAKIRIVTTNGTTIVASPFAEDPIAMSAYLPVLMDALTVNPSPTIPGRININRAPRLVLDAIPGITPEIVDQILNQRDPENSEFMVDLSHETWLLGRAIVTLEEMRIMMPYITAGGDVYRAQVVGYFDEGEISSRAEVIVDGTLAYPRILSWKDISHLGRGYAAATLGVDLTSSSSSTAASASSPNSAYSP